MGLFGGKPKSYLGIDIGTAGIKMVEIGREDGRPRLLTYAYTERQVDDAAPGYIDQLDKTADLLKKMVTKAKAGSKMVISGLPGSSVLSSVITVPALSGK